MGTRGNDGKRYPFLANYWLDPTHDDSLSGSRGYIMECPYSLPDYELKRIELRRNKRLKMGLSEGGCV